MKKIVVYDIDGLIPNLALMKISTFYKKQGYEVSLSKGIKYLKADRYFASTVFHNEDTKLKIKALFSQYGSDIQIGGSGICLKKKMPDEIDSSFPDYHLYHHEKYAIGFLTRGCNKRCPFCLVPRKEGRLNSHYADFDDFVPKHQKNVMLLDNNLLAAENATEILGQIIQRNYRVNFSQSLDICRLTNKNVELLQQVKSVNSRFTKPMVYFSCNSLSQRDHFLAKEKLLRSFGRQAVTVIIMFGYNTRLSEDYGILMMTKQLGLIPFVQQYLPVPGIPSKIPEDYFDMNLDVIADIRFRTNGQNNEKFLRYVSRRYFQQFGKYYLPLLKAIYRYNNKSGINKFLQKPHLLSEKQLLCTQ
jgi:hypothetical protein